MSLSILNPSFINKSKNTDFNYQVYKDSPYYPYTAWLKNGNNFLFGFLLKRIKTNSNNRYKIFIILKFLTNKNIDFDKKSFKKYKIANNYLYSTISLKTKLKKIDTLNDLKRINRFSKSNNTKYTNNKNHKKSYNFITINKLTNLIRKNKTLFETGAGISYKVIPSFNKIRTYIGKYYNIEKILLHPDKIINRFEKWFMKAIYSNPTIGHKSLKTICKITNSGLITGNFDNLHSKSGIIPINVQRNNYDLKKNIKKIKLLVVIGVDRDFVNHEFFRKNGVKIIIFALNKNTIPYFAKDEDYIILGDLHKNLYNLNRLLLNYYKLYNKK